MKIAIIVTHLSHSSPGSFYRPYEMAKQLTNFKIDNVIYSPYRDDVDRFKDISLVEIPTISQKIGLTNFFENALRKVIYHKQWGKIINYEYLILKLSDKIITNMKHSMKTTPDIIQGEQLVASYAAVKLGIKHKIPIVIDIHNIWAEELVANGIIKTESKSFKNLIKLEKYVIDNSDKIIVVSEHLKNYLVENLDCNKKKISIIPPGANIHFEHNNDSLTEKISVKKIIYAGLVNPREHVDLFVNSIPYITSKFPKTQYYISKKGESFSQISDLCKNLTIKPHFFWYKSREKARELIKQSYIGALPSRNDLPRKLGTPLKLMEYLSYGLPVVANDVGSWCDIIEKNNVGILTNDSPKDFAEGINKLLEDESLYKTMRNNIFNLVCNKFNWKTLVQNRLIPLYNNLIS